MKTLPLILSALAFGLVTLPAAAQETEIADTTVITQVDGIVVRTVSGGSSSGGMTKGNTFCMKDYFIGGQNKNKGHSSSSSTRVPKRWKWHGGHWAGVGLYYNGLVQDLGNLSLPDGAEYMQQSPKSIGVNLNFADFTIVSNRHFGLITGLGLEMNNFRFDRNIGLTQDPNGAIAPDYSYDTEGIDLKKSKLTTVYLNIPLLVEFQFGHSKSGNKSPGFVNFGVIGGVRLQGHTKVKYHDPEEGDTRTIKQHNGLNLRNFHYGVECNVGYKWVALSAQYYPHSIFVPGEGPDLQQVNIGLSFMF